MQRYRSLNLKKLRDEAGLDFAHFTYQRGQCSCCYGPQDMPDRYWAKGKKPKEIDHVYRDDGSLASFKYDRPLEDIQYILFKNASNGSGVVTKEDTICEVPDRRRKSYWFHTSPRHRVCIEWQFPIEKMDMVLGLLWEQLDEDYAVIRPKDKYHCIEIVCKSDLQEEDYANIYTPPSKVAS